MMKYLISTYLLIILGLVCNYELRAQIVGYNPKVVVGVSARIINETSLITIRDVNLNGANAVAGILSISPITSSYSGMMRINSTPNSLVRITYLSNETLIDEEGSEGMVKARYIISGFTSDNQAASTLLDAGEAIVRMSSDGRYFIWLGAELDLTKAKPGNYKSEFLIEIEAN